jgi:hypothetical protein
MIEFPRRLARQFHRVLRRGLLGPGARGPWPVVLCRTDEQGLTLQARQDELAVRYQADGARPPETLAFAGSVLAEWAGNNESSVTLEALNTHKGSARWLDGRVHRTIEFDLDDPEKVPSFPKLPPKAAVMPEHFLRALDAACQATAREPSRYALYRILLRGQTGEVIATDGHQLLIQGGFSFPWQEDVLVPRLPIFDQRELIFSSPATLGRTDSQVGLYLGPWTLLLAIDRTGRFPDLTRVIPPETEVTCRLQLHPADAAFLADALPRLPKSEQTHEPVTLDLGRSVVVRARDGATRAVTEVLLSRSTVTGQPVRLALARRLLQRVVPLGFSELQLIAPDKPVVCRDGARTFALMPVSTEGIVNPARKVRRITSVEESPAPSPEPDRRTNPMPEPSTNGRTPANPSPEKGGIDDLIAEAEALRTLLSDASTRAGRLLAALKQHRRQARAVRAAVNSLRQLPLDG